MTEKLFIHPNTLCYRLAKIEQIIDLSFNKIDDVLDFI
ncbi:PucR family transcriptional regulator [Rodentibacter caecimuris]|nr:PucR family transcriptional regulator [Rodentibacter heylii]